PRSLGSLACRLGPVARRRPERLDSPPPLDAGRPRVRRPPLAPPRRRRALAVAIPRPAVRFPRPPAPAHLPFHLPALRLAARVAAHPPRRVLPPQPGRPPGRRSAPRRLGRPERTQGDGRGGLRRRLRLRADPPDERRHPAAC